MCAMHSVSETRDFKYLKLIHATFNELSTQMTCHYLNSQYGKVTKRSVNALDKYSVKPRVFTWQRMA